MMLVGVITGTTTRGAFTGSPLVTAEPVNGILTGLIGAQGAVGAFISGSNIGAVNGSTKDNIIGNADSGVAYVGGFVAAPAYVPPSVATHANFKTYYADSARVAGRRLHPTPTTTNDVTAFLEGTATSLPTDGLSFTAANTFAPVTVRLKEASSGDDGFAIMYTDGASFRAGLLSGTDLGPAVPTTSTATWAGSLHFWIVGSNTPNRIALPTVTVDFANGTIKTDAVTVGTNRTVAIDGLFLAGSNNNTLPVGVLGGRAIYNDGSSFDLSLIGLIGTEGAIGVFHGDNLVFVGGGFQASPN